VVIVSTVVLRPRQEITMKLNKTSLQYNTGITKKEILMAIIATSVDRNHKIFLKKEQQKRETALCLPKYEQSKQVFMYKGL
jgi:hypothetical protein